MLQPQVTTALSLIHTPCSSLQHALSLLSLLCVNQSSANGGLSLYLVPELPPCLSYQLTRTEPQRSSNWLTHSLTNSLHCTNSTTRSFDWYSLGVDHIGNTASNSTFIVACRPLHSNGFSTVACLRSCCLSVVVVSYVLLSLPSDGSICHNM
jgi:hypothetical protein